MMEQAVMEAKNEVIRVLGGALRGNSYSVQAVEPQEEIPVMIQAEEDDTVADLALQWFD